MAYSNSTPAAAGDVHPAGLPAEHRLGRRAHPAGPAASGIDQLLDVSPVSLGGAVVLFGVIVGGMAWLVRRRGGTPPTSGSPPG